MLLENRRELQDISETTTPWREAIAAFNPLELWHAFQEAEEQVCLMAVPLRDHHDERR